MSKIFTILLCFLYLQSVAGAGDTITVQTFTNGSPQNAWFVFPKDTVRCEKIYMKYTLKCNPAQTPACGEWDYLTYTYLYKHTGFLDSTKNHQPVFKVNNQVLDSFSYSLTPTYSYHAAWQYYMVNTATNSLTTDTVGSGNAILNHPFNSQFPSSHSQYIWKSSELTASGLTAGAISGLQFYIQSLGGTMQQLVLKIKATGLDSLTNQNYADTGFTTVYNKNTSFLTLGWNSLQFLQNFNWNGTSNLLVDVSFTNAVGNTSTLLLGTTSGFKSGITSAGADRVASFHSNSFVTVPINNSIAAIDTMVTVSFWCYGDPQLQPSNGILFEAVDTFGNRVLNAHLPWSDQSVYWDAGNVGSAYDRINKAASVSEYKGKWNYWAFTKNTVTGTMRIYLNGNLWHIGASKTKHMSGIKQFRIGKGNTSGAPQYEGRVDEFAVFNTELSLSDIQNYMYRKIDINHPNYNHLAAYYSFDDGNYISFADSAAGNHAAAICASVDNPLRKGSEINTRFISSTYRPNVIFEKGIYTQHIDSVLVIDSSLNKPIQIVYYADSVLNPGTMTATLNVWPTYYNHYLYNSAGIAIDSFLVPADATIYLTYYDWYNKFPQIIRYELGRYITPYGNGLSLGSGWTWTFDVSDYRTLLADSVHLSAGNWQELLDVKFLLIKGIPPRDPISVTNLWNGGFNYGVAADPIDNHLTAKTITLANTAKNTRWKSRVTGHGMDTPENCAEFCAKYHYYKINGTQQFSKLVWRDNCSKNPLYPQGGTWTYSRANWCPGAEVWTYDWELSPFTTPGTVVSLDHDVELYNHTGGWDYYQIEDQLVTYNNPNFSLDAAMEEILTPSVDQMWGRMNPVCSGPVVRIKNTGTTTLTSLTITYGLANEIPSIYHWTGNLKFMESQLVTLGKFGWVQGPTTFSATVSAPNGGADQYNKNNSATTKFISPVVVPNQIVIEFKSNNAPAENFYSVKDANGTIISSKNTFNPNTVYYDTLDLVDGCYTFEMTDLGEDGLSWWANTAQGSGYLRIKRMIPSTIIKTFNPDFGSQAYLNFTVGLSSNTDDYLFTTNSEMSVQPNPSNGLIYVDVNLNEKKDGILEVFNLMGQKVYSYAFTKQVALANDIDLSRFGKGIYLVNLRSGKEVITKKVIIQ